MDRPAAWVYPPGKDAPMLRRLAALLLALLTTTALAELPADPVARRLTAQTAMGTAKRSLAADRAADAALTLEAALPCAEGDPAFLALLRSAYSRELAQGPSADRAATLTQRIQLLTGTGLPPVAEHAEAAPEAQSALRRATQLFQQGGEEPGKLADAAKFFASAFQKVEMTPEQLAAWAFCRIRVANDRAGQGADPAEIRAEIAAARKLAPDSAPVRERAEAVLAALPSQPKSVAARAESANFKAVGVASPVAAKLVEAAEAHRKAIHTYWAGQAPRDWATKCELVLHPNAAALAQATQSAGSGSATVTTEGQRVTRKLHLAADDPALTDVTLPRELTHLIVADLFPAKAPPQWAAIGMAAIATSAGEQGRYLRTLDRLAAAGQTLPAAGVLGAATPPADRITAYHVESLAMVQYLANLKGGPAFVEFLTQSDRYGVAGALKKLYGVTDVALLEGAWRK